MLYFQVIGKGFMDTEEFSGLKGVNRMPPQVVPMYPLLQPFGYKRIALYESVMDETR